MKHERIFSNASISKWRNCGQIILNWSKLEGCLSRFHPSHLLNENQKHLELDISILYLHALLFNGHPIYPYIVFLFQHLWRRYLTIEFWTERRLSFCDENEQESRHRQSYHWSCKHELFCSFRSKVQVSDIEIRRMKLIVLNLNPLLHSRWAQHSNCHTRLIWASSPWARKERLTDVSRMSRLMVSTV